MVSLNEISKMTSMNHSERLAVLITLNAKVANNNKL
jgi:predicted Fe-S protein YdhL (DUF1289 family)